jgi:hypothetical protein
LLRNALVQVLFVFVVNLLNFGKAYYEPLLGRIGLFKGKMITLCGRVTDIPMIVHETSTEEEFEIITFIENNAPFPLLLGKTWIEKDQIKRKIEEEATE